MLLERGGDINARNKNGLTPFVLASKNGLTEIIRVLVQHGSNSDTHTNTNLISFWRSTSICDMMISVLRRT